MTKIPIEITAKEILQTYVGSNDYLLELKNTLVTKKRLPITRNIAEYIINNHKIKPIVLNKKYALHKSCRKFIQTQYNLETEPEFIFINKLLTRKGGTIHVWGCFRDDCKFYSSIYITKNAIKRVKSVELPSFEQYKRKPLPHQLPAIKALLENDKFILADDMGLGKMELITNKLYTPNGRKKIGDILVGDRVIGSDGKPCNVTGVYPQGEMGLYKVTFNDGYSVKCGGEHLWSVASTNNGVNNKNRETKYVTLSVNQMLDNNLIMEQKGVVWNEKRTYKYSTFYKKPNGDSKWQIPIVQPIHFENNDELPIDPYLLGLSLGDGHITNTTIIFQVHENDYDELFNSYDLTENKKDLNRRKGNIYIGDEILNGLKLSNTRSDTKFIPDIYKYSSIDDRLAILQGLMDTDGHCMKSENGNFIGTEYATVSEKLADDVAEIVHSLGGIVRKKSKIGSYKKEDGTKVICKRCYRLNIKMPDGMNPFRLKRKANAYNPPKKYKVSRYIQNIEPCGVGEAVCISVDSPDKLYVTEHAIVTHNTTSSIMAALTGGYKRILVVCTATLKLNWKKEIETFESSNDISIVEGSDFTCKKWTIINYDILKNFHFLPEKGQKPEDVSESIIDFYKFDLVIADECFPYKTLVDTNVGKLEIGEIVEKSLNVNILSYNINSSRLEYKPIKRWIKKENDTILKLSLQNGLFIECTPNHKVYVKNKGYVRADKININDELLTLSESVNEETNMEEGLFLFKKLLTSTPKSNRCELAIKNEGKCFKKEKNRNRKNLRLLQRGFSNKKQIETFLQPELLGKVENESTRNKKESTQPIRNRKNKNIKYKKLQRKSRSGVIFIGTDETLESNEQSIFNREDEKFVKRSNILSSWWERKNNAGTENVRPFGGSLEITSPNQHCGCKREFQIITTSVPSGLRERRFKNRNRGRWENTPNQEMEIFGQKKNRSLGSIRVEDIEILESGSGRSDRKLFEGDKRVYNIEVADNHNYFADGILVSNCHYLKNATSNRTKLFNDFAMKIPTRWLLTGTPITNKPIDIFNLLYLCDSPLTDNWVHFVRRYCEGKQFNRKGTTQKYWVTGGASNLSELNEYISDTFLRRLKKDAVDLPEKTIKEVYLPLTMSKRYTDYLEDYKKWMDEQEENDIKPKPSEHLTQLVKVRQLLSEDKAKHSIELAEEFIETGNKVIIFSCFTNTLSEIYEHFGKSAVMIDGSVSAKNRDVAVERFQNDPKIKVFCGNIVAAGAGITLTEGTIVIFNDLDWVPANHAQATDRVHRIGQTKDVYIIYLLVDDTIDNVMHKGLQDKMRNIQLALGDQVFTDISLVNEVINAVKD